MSSHWSIGTSTVAPGLERVLPGLSLSSKASRPIPIKDESWLNSFDRRLTPPRRSPSPSPPVARPTRQPAKSKYALWVGNLPTKPTLEELCQLFGTPQLISVYLIHRTGCAFVNYSSSEALDEAVQLFHSRGAKIRDHKLVIKVQKRAINDFSPEISSPPVYGGDSYFICKSLTVEDLDAAKAAGQWSTQAHNRDKFNTAFAISDNVYFIFSANRTSSFYGYARMMSPIPEGDLSPVNAPKVDEAQVIAVPAYSSQGVEYPAGNIVEDTTRGCLFWEAHGQGEPKEAESACHWTAPCKIEWLSDDSQVMFSRTRQIRNPLNANKPVKVARDGTEIEPSIGAQLRELFETK